MPIKHVFEGKGQLCTSSVSVLNESYIKDVLWNNKVARRIVKEKRIFNV